MALRDRVTLLRGTEQQDPYTGNFVLVYSVVGEHRAEVQPLRAEEYTDQRSVTVTYYRVYLPPVEVLATDRVRWDGGDYDVDGEPERHKARGRLHHVEAVLKRVGG